MVNVLVCFDRYDETPRPKVIWGRKEIFNVTAIGKSGQKRKAGTNAEVMEEISL